MPRTQVLRAVLVLLVLATGVALGAGPLQDDATEQQRALDRATAALDRARDRAAAAEGASAAADRGIAAVAPGLVRGALTGRSVTLLLMPETDGDQLASLQALVKLGGGQFTGTVELTPAATDAQSRQLVEALTTQLGTQSKVLSAAADRETGTYARLGALLALAVAAGPDGPAALPRDRVAIGSGLATADLVGGIVPEKTSDLVLVALPDAPVADAAALAEVLAGLGRNARVVVVGPSPGGGDSNGAAATARTRRSVIERLRAAPVEGARPSTVEGIGTALGRVAAVLALAEQARGDSGDYGPDADASPLPTVDETSDPARR